MEQEARDRREAGEQLEETDVPDERWPVLGLVVGGFSPDALSAPRAGTIPFALVCLKGDEPMMAGMAKEMARGRRRRFLEAEDG